MKRINYTGSSKLISRIVHLLNRKAPLPLDGDGDAVWGTNGQVLTTDGQGNTSWTDKGGGGGDVTDVEVNGTSVVNAQGVAEVSVPTATSDLNNDSGFIDGTDLSTALSDYTPTANLATVATSGDYDDLSNKPSIPTVGDGTITIQKNGTTVDTFTTNQSTNKTVNITVTEGHTIWNRIKTALTSRAALWFADASVSDDSADGATKVEVVTELASENAFDALATDGTADGVYCFPDSGAEYLTADNVGYDGTSSGLSATDAQGAVDELCTTVNGKVSKSGDTMTGQLILAANGFRTSSTEGYALDQWGNFVHASPGSSNYFAIRSNGGENKFRVFFETGDAEFSGPVTINKKDGTTSAIGYSSLVVGNNTPQGTSGNSEGQILLYGKNSANAVLRATNMTASRTHELPDKSGTIALTSDTIKISAFDVEITTSTSRGAGLYANVANLPKPSGASVIIGAVCNTVFDLTWGDANGWANAYTVSGTVNIAAWSTVQNRIIKVKGYILYM